MYWEFFQKKGGHPVSPFLQSRPVFCVWLRAPFKAIGGGLFFQKLSHFEVGNFVRYLIYKENGQN